MSTRSSTDPVPRRARNGAANGKAVGDPGAGSVLPRPLASAPQPGTPAPNAASSSAADVLRAEMKALRHSVDQATAAAATAGGITTRHLAAVEQMSIEFQALPDRLAEALEDALARQHRLIVSEVRTALREFAAASRPPSPTTEGDPASPAV